MGFFDLKWIVEIEYSDGFFRSNKKESIIVDALNDYEAKLKVKKDPQYQHKYLWIRSVKCYDLKPKVETQEITIQSKPLTEQERAELDARWEEYEKQEKIRAKQKAISTQQAKINKIEKSPIIAAIISGIISLIAFLLGWIPYWYFDRLLTTTREKILWYEKTGYDPNSDTIVFLYNQGLQAKQSRDSVLWIPFVILGIGIVATVTIVILVNKTKHKRLIKARKELEELKK